MPLALPANTLPPAQPIYVLRGHAAAIHTILFFRSNTRLLTGDADGWIVIWSVVIKRPVAVWRAHEATILGAHMWEKDKIITHGRDNKICAWSLSEDEEKNMSTELPIDASTTHRKQPWLLHTLNTATVNFCSFATCIVPPSGVTNTEAQTTNVEVSPNDDPKDKSDITEPQSTSKQALLAVSGLHDSTIDLYQLPSEKKVGSIPAPTIINTKTGMVMSLKLFFHNNSDLYVIAGYESGRTYVFKRVMPEQRWEAIYTSIPHSQPILSLDISPGLDFYVTSSADAVVAKHRLLSNTKQDAPLKEVQTRHAGQQGLKMRSDSRVFATAGWDSRVRVYSAKSMKELAVLKWHKEGVYAVAFADVDGEQDNGGREVKQEVVKKNDSGSVSVRQAREDKARKTHWLAAGAKDGKVSLWDIY